jgi:UDP-N-acetyl-D-mannosaminuronic acid dehydrogenase
MDKVCVVGLGYIGLPTASILATHGYRVIGSDINQALINRLQNGDVDIREPGLKTLVQAGLRSGNLSVAGEPAPADVFIIAVPTPIAPDKQADLRYVEASVRSIVPHIRPGNLIILESTVPPGTTAGLFASILAESGLDPRQELMVVHSPERVLPGRILEELVSNDRVIGGLTTEAAARAGSIYASFVQGEIYLTDATTAELVKLMENTFRDVNIVLANEFAQVAEAIGVNVWQAIEIANRHPRVNILSPGPGVGGHCIAVDPWFLVQAAPGPAQLIAAARRLNDHMPKHVAEQVLTILAMVKRPRVAALGLAYKANVDDARESPSLTVIRWLQAAGCEVSAYDPLVPRHATDITGATSLEEAVTGADCILLLTNHDTFSQLDPALLGELMRRRVLVDTRNALPHMNWKSAGFEVHLLGHGDKRDVSPRHMNVQVAPEVSA